MSLLWTQAMPWEQRDKGKVHTPVPVRDAGFKGLVLPSAETHEDMYGEPPAYARSTHEHMQKHFDEDLYDKVAPKVEPHHLDEHGDHTDEYHEEHGQAYADAVQHKIDHEERPDHEDDDLHNFVGAHVDNNRLWNTHGAPKKVDLSKGVYATQTHVSQEHLDRYARDRHGPTWTKIQYPHEKEYGGGYAGDKLPMFVTHQGRLHAIEGHHRVASDLLAGRTSTMGYHYDADKHGFPDHEDN